MGRKPRHGMSYSPEYRVYQVAKDRCTNPNSQRWNTHGKRGIKFLFKTFEEFYEEIGPRPSSDYSLERKDNNGNYEVGNIKWATRSEQQRNKRPFTHKIRHGKGYYWHKASNKWMARVRWYGKTIYLGVFDKQTDAKVAYKTKLKELIEG